MKTKRMIASLMAILLAVCFQVTALASTSTWSPKSEEVFRNSGLTIYDSTSTAVATSIEIVSHPQTLSFTGVPQFFSSDGRKLGDMGYAARVKLEEEYKAHNNNSVDGFALWLVNMFNEYRGVGKTTQQAMDDYWEKGQADAAAKKTEWEGKQRSDLSALTYQDVFAGAEITVTNKTAQAVRVGAYDFPITAKTKVYFTGSDGSNLGYMAGDAYLAMTQACHKTYGEALNKMPGGSEGFYAQLFNDYRGVKRLTVDEYLDIVKVNPLGLSAESWRLLEQVYGKSAGGYSGDPQATALQYEQYRKEVFRLVNIERAKAGLSEVVWDDDFAACAQIRAEEMTRKASHERPEPPEDTSKEWPANINGNGIYNAPSVADEQGVPHNWIMENAGYGYRSAEAAVQGWMNSPGHRANILREGHVRCGVGVYYAKEYPAGGCQVGWALWFDDYDGSSSPKSSSCRSSGSTTNGTTYSLNETEIRLSAGEGYQLSVDVSGPAKDIEIEWVGSKIGGDILSVDDNGYVTSFYRDGLTSATATLNVSAKIYVSGKLVTTLRCKVIVTQ